MQDPRMKDSISSFTKSCILCKSVGRNHIGHDTSNCWFISKFDKLQIAKALRVDLDDDKEKIPFGLEEDGILSLAVSNENSTIQKVQSNISPYLYTFYKHRPCHVVIDTDAASLVSKAFLKQCGIPMRQTSHPARGVEKSSLKVEGEVHLSLDFSSLSLPITALVVSSLSTVIF